jgi:hypothetical protein
VRFLPGALLLLLLALSLLPATALGADPKLDPCKLALGPADVPGELQREPNQSGGWNLSDDPTMCEHLYWAFEPGPSGLTAIRSLVILAPSVQQARADFKEYRSMLVDGGWEEVSGADLGDEALLFSGNDPDQDIYSVQQVFRRKNVVVLTDATGPLLADEPEAVLDLARIVDRRASRELTTTLASTTTTVRPSSPWPLVSKPTLVRDAILPAIPLGSQAGQAGQSGQSAPTGLQLGGFSGLVSLDREGKSFLTVTDRGPNTEIGKGSDKKVVLPLPGYTPSIVKLSLLDGQLKVVDRLPLRLAGSSKDPRTNTPFVTGLPISDHSAPVYDSSGKNNWGTDPYGVDPEGLALDPRDGSFWVCEEYGPSLLHVADDGTVLTRLIPTGTSLKAPGVNVRAILPAELTKRKENRGFEGVAISPAGTRLFALFESPLSIPNESVGEGSRNIRLITLDLTRPDPKVDGMYVYQTEPYASTGAAAQDDIKTGDLSALSQTRLLVAERDNTAGGRFKMVYSIDLTGATNILGRSDFGGHSLEQSNPADLTRLGLKTVVKTKVVNLTELGWSLAGFEGLTLIDDSTIAVTDDNNFGFGGFDKNGQIVANNIPTRLSIVQLPGSLR